MSDAERELPGHVYSTSEIEIVRDRNCIQARSLLYAGCFGTVIFTGACVLAFGFVSLGMYMLISMFLPPFQWSNLLAILLAGPFIVLGAFFILLVADSLFLSRRSGRYCLTFEPGVGWFLRRLVLAPKFVGPRIEVAVKRRRVRYGEVIHWIAVKGARTKPFAFGTALTPIKKRDRLAMDAWLNRHIADIEREYSSGTDPQ